MSESNNWKVYAHFNKLNNKAYIGITKRNPKYRFRNGKGYYANKHFTSAIEKYGWDGFTHEILADHLTLEQASEIERAVIGVLNTTDRAYGYNIRSGGIDGDGMSEEGRASLRFHNTGTNAPNRRPVTSFDIDGNRLLDFPFTRAAARYYNVSPHTITQCCRKTNHTKSCRGIIYRYTEEVNGIDHLPEEEVKVVNSPQHPHYTKRSKEVSVFDMSGNLVMVLRSVTDAKAVLGSTAIDCLIGNQKTVSGKYIAIYSSKLPDNCDTLPQDILAERLPYPTAAKPVNQYDMSGKYIQTFQSGAEAARQLSCKAQAICLCASGGSSSSHGFQWRYDTGDHSDIGDYKQNLYARCQGANSSERERN